MRTAKLLLSILVFTFFISAQINSQQVIQDWVARFDGAAGNQDFGYSVTVDNNGNAIVTGQTFSPVSGNDMVTIKYNPDGIQQWVNIFNGASNQEDYGIGLVTDNSGNVYVTGNSQNGSLYDIVTIKYDPDGVQQWTRFYNGPGGSHDISHGIAIDNSANIYITGESVGAGTSYDYVTLKYNSAGALQWVSRFNGGLADVSTSIVLDNSNNVIVTGYSFNPASFYNYATVKYNSAGVLQWSQTYSGAGGGNDLARAIDCDNLGNICVTGNTFDAVTGRDYLTIMYNSSGVQQWAQTYNDPLNSEDDAYAIGFDGSGNVFVTGHSPGVNGTMDFATIKYSSTGVMQWLQKYHGLAPTSSDFGRSLCVDASGNVYVAGQSQGAGTGFDYATLKYSPAGTLMWAQRYNGPGSNFDLPVKVVLDAGNSVYVTGYSRGIGLIYDIATIKYFQCALAVNAGNDTTIYKGYGSETAVLTANVQGEAGSVSYIWSNSATTQTIVVSPSQTTTYWVTVTDSKGCMATDTVTVNVINVTCGHNNNKVLVCHNGHTICISSNAVPAHLTLHEGDYLGPCSGDQIVIEETADKFVLYNNYPNPFNPVTAIKFDIPMETSVKLQIYDALGREVAVLVNGKLKAGSHSVTWNAENYASGIYFYKLESAAFTEIKKMVLVK